MTASAVDLLYVITDLKVGGVPLHLLKLATEMTRRDVCCHVVSLAPAGPIAKRLESAGITVTDCAARGSWDLGVMDRLANQMATLAPRCVHSLLFHANVATRLAWRSVGGNPQHLICEIQTVEVQRRWHLWGERWTHHLCRGVVCNSPSVLEHLAKYAGVPREHLFLIRGGVDTARIAGATPVERSRFGGSAEERLILWVGRLDPVKNLDTLIEAFALLPESPRCRLVLIGDGPMRDQIKKHVERRDLSDRVMLLGTRDDVPSFLRAADLFVFPSRTEGLPNALLEAMAAGCPIVTTDVPGCRDLITHERTGLIVPHGDTDALVGAMQQLLSDRDFAEQLGRRAAEEVALNWKIEQTFDAYAALYHEVRTA